MFLIHITQNISVIETENKVIHMLDENEFKIDESGQYFSKIIGFYEMKLKYEKRFSSLNEQIFVLTLSRTSESNRYFDLEPMQFGIFTELFEKLFSQLDFRLEECTLRFITSKEKSVKDILLQNNFQASFVANCLSVKDKHQVECFAVLSDSMSDNDKTIVRVSLNSEIKDNKNFTVKRIEAYAERLYTIML